MTEFHPPWDDRSGMWTPEIRAMERNLISVLAEANRKAMNDEWPEGAIAVTKNLDLLVEQDEPTLLVDQLRQVAERLVDESSQGELWDMVAKSMVELSSDMRAKNEPGHSTDAKDE